MGRLEQIKAKWDKNKNKVLTEKEIKNKVAEKHIKQMRYDNNRRS
jgi:hypothetical protein